MLISALVKPNFDPTPVCSSVDECFTTNLQRRKSSLAVRKTVLQKHKDEVHL